MHVCRNNTNFLNLADAVKKRTHFYCLSTLSDIAIVLINQGKTIDDDILRDLAIASNKKTKHSSYSTVLGSIAKEMAKYDKVIDIYEVHINLVEGIKKGNENAATAFLEIATGLIKTGRDIESKILFDLAEAGNESAIWLLRQIDMENKYSGTSRLNYCFRKILNFLSGRLHIKNK